MNKKVYIIEDTFDFYPRHVFECGQCFRWNCKPDGSYSGIAGGRAANIRFEPKDKGFSEEGGRLIITEIGKLCGENSEEKKPFGQENAEHKSACAQGTRASEGEAFWRSYLDLDRDYGKIKRKLIRGDQVMKKAVSFGWGIHILNQDLWETILSFIISQNNNIPRIKGCIENLAALFGEPVAEVCGEETEKNPVIYEKTGKHTVMHEKTEAAADSAYSFGSRILYSLPGPEKLASLTVEELAPVKLGYRAGYLIKTAQTVCEKGLPFDEASLRQLCGVGPKVADCISLFGMSRYESFPVDVWVARVMNRLYGLDEGNRNAIAEFAGKKFGSLGGFAQQYLFYYMRENN